VKWSASSCEQRGWLGRVPHRVLSAVCAASLTVACAGFAAAAIPVLETPGVGSAADADDPAFWIHPTDRSRSLVLTAVKDGGARVYDLQAGLIQSLSPFPSGSPVSRFNNIDVQYGFLMADGSRRDLAVATDRGRDVLRIWSIDAGAAGGPLSYIGAADPSRLFPTRPTSADNPLSAQNTGYGLALYRDVRADKLYALATQRSQARIAQYELVAQNDGTVGYQFVRDWSFPSMTVGTTTVSLTGRQFEGMVVDQQTGMLYAGQEDVGIWRVDLATGFAEPDPFVLSRTYAPGSPLLADIEGVTIYYGSNGAGYLLASSQGNNSFAVFERSGANAYLGSFSVNSGNGIDSVQESDGADVTNLALPGYPQGLFVTQDGANAPSGDTNFKYVSWAEIAAEQGLAIDTLGYDPRHPLAPVPEPTTALLMLAGLGALASRRYRRITTIHPTNGV
jgi:3-phytase